MSSHFAPPRLAPPTRIAVQAVAELKLGGTKEYDSPSFQLTAGSTNWYRYTFKKSEKNNTQVTMFGKSKGSGKDDVPMTDENMCIDIELQKKSHGVYLDWLGKVEDGDSSCGGKAWSEHYKLLFKSLETAFEHAGGYTHWKLHDLSGPKEGCMHRDTQYCLTDPIKHGQTLYVGARV